VVSRLSVIAAWALALLLVAATFAAGDAPAQSKPVSIDASITRQVESALAHDPFLRNMSIRVETNGGVVSLTGFVRSVDDIAKAGEVVRAVTGVSAVRNGLRVENRPTRA
jgi:osmotically-inducible protein OsmY